MKSYRIQILTPLTVSLVGEFIADSEMSAISKAREFFFFRGPGCYIKVLNQTNSENMEKKS
jgi:hypothetical protein